MDFNKLEKKILSFWKENKIFEKSIRRRQNSPYFVFFEGPPTTNGHPGIHHFLARAFKDIILRYRTMRGFRVLRKAGWDTHGLPVELAVEKELKLKNKKDIEKYGIARFNKRCRHSADSYRKEWEELTRRMGYWLDMDNPYVTYSPDYMETIWWIIKKIYEKGLLYKDYKVSPYCPRCGTTLSSHEVALGYKKIKEPAIYIKFRLQNPKDYNLKVNTYFLVWTTTPWTLPANVALAINPSLTYAEIKSGKEHFILLKERAKEIGIRGEIIKEFKGNDLVGLEYEPLFPLKANIYDLQSAYKVIKGNFVSSEEGTGIVHIAPAFGEDDMNAIKTQNSKLKTQKLPEIPILITIDEEGKFKPEVKPWAGLFFKKADPLIIQELKNRKLLFKEELYEHDYPFCWRCGTPLVYYPRKSWFIKITEVKRELIKNSKEINWIPSYLKEGRFGEWLKEVKDWALSRERYWGTPLPIWECEKCGHKEIVGGIKDFKKQKFSKNRYFILRHGESLKNVNNIEVCWPEKILSPLTKKGQKQILKAAQKLKDKKIDIIISSDLLRTKETAEIVGKELKIKTILDPRLREINFGVFNGKNAKEMAKFIDPNGKFTHRENLLRRFNLRYPKGENYFDIQKRVYRFLKDVEKRYQSKRILIVSHCRTLTILEALVNGWNKDKIVDYIIKKKEIKKGELRKIRYRDFPYNEKLEIDFHRPYVDKVKFQCPVCGKKMKRVPEVIDVWFDSGSMPFAQWHYPFENRKIIDNKIQYPANYISEAIDQTRGWFYTLLAISTLLGFGPSYKNVVSLGHVVDEKGEKMSKSKGNIVNPWEEIEKFGADAIRWYFFTVNGPGDVKKYVRKDVFHKWQRTGITLLNCWKFFKTYAPKKKFDSFRINKRTRAENIIDRWGISIFTNKVILIKDLLDHFFITKAAREIDDLIDQLSNWYLRRSRQRFQNAKKLKELEIFYSLLFNITLIIAPFVPLTSEFLFQEMKKYSKNKVPESVHLANWPKIVSKNIDKKLEEEMEWVRDIIKRILAERARLGIKVRQPLASVRIRTLDHSEVTAGKQGPKLRNNKELLNLIKEEVNVKEIVFDSKIKKEIKLDTKITPELKKEGMGREIIRCIQGMRKKLGLTPRDKISIYYSVKESFLQEVLLTNKKDILEQTKGGSLLVFSGKEKPELTEEFNIYGERIKIGIRKVLR